MLNRLKTWWKSGDPWIWLNAGAVSASVIIVFGLLALIIVRGMGHFWPGDVTQFQYEGEQGEVRIIGEFVESEMVNSKRYEESGLGKAPEGQEYIKRWIVKTGNRELYTDFRWINEYKISSRSAPEDIVVLERVEWGSFYGYLQEVKENDVVVASGEGAWEDF